MAEDKREAILARLVEIAKTIVEPACVFRNQIDIPEKERPAIVILDGDEETDESAFDRKRPANSPLIVGMMPELFILLEAKADTVGAELNEVRGRFVKAVLTDSLLVALCHEGDIRYHGFATGLAVGRSMEGEAGVSFTFNYVLRPTRL